MPIRRLSILLAATALATLTLAPAAAADNNKADNNKGGNKRSEHSEERARSALEAARKAAEIEGMVATVGATASTFVVTYKGQGVPLSLGSVSLLSLNDQPVTLADIKVGDKADVTAVAEAGTGRLVAYVARFKRATPPMT